MNNRTMVYNKLMELSDPNGVNAQTLALLLGMSRSNVSHELNNLYKEGKVSKSSGRPVLFFVNRVDTKKEMTELDELIQNNISLKDAAEQAKAAILYPPRGLASLILGGTGVGKSMFASLMHSYTVAMGVREKDSPFIVFNCADYSNNPQLLVSQLFGVKKGTYTGAEADKAGLIEKADGGVLFLDEVHRLPPEGQETLFTFLDSSTFRRMGDNEVRRANVLIITATTEDPGSTLLQTFTRRIPMVIKIPSLKERTFDERLYLIKNFFKQESIKLDREIYVSCNTIRAFLSYDCTNNIGQLKSDVQLICAKAYSEFLTNIRGDVRISSRSLPPYIREGLLKEKEHRILWNKLTGEEIEYFRFSPTMDTHQLSMDQDDNRIYEIIEEKLEQLKSKGISDIDIEHILEKDISKHFQKYISGISEEINKKDILNLLGEDILYCVDEVVEYMSTSMNRSFSNNIYTALALHIDTLIKRIQNKKTIVNPQLSKIKELYPKEFKIAFNAKSIIDKYLHHTISEDEAGYLTIFLLPEDHVQKAAKSNVKIILIAHGTSTASSMADVANRLLGSDHTIAIDAPLEESPSLVLNKLKEVVKKDLNTGGYLLLVDMGSLTTFSDIIQSEFKIPSKAIPLVSTLHVIEATRKALLGFTLDEVYKDVLLVHSYVETNRNFNDTMTQNKKIAIITTCLTGEGGSVAVKSILNNSLKYDKNLFEIITLNCLDKTYFKQNLNRIKSEREILFIVSSFPIDTDIRQYNMYDVISMSVMGELQEQIDIKATLVKMPSVLRENIHNLDGFELFQDITRYLKDLQESSSIKLKDATLVGLILHMAFMISRLKNGESTVEYPNKEKYIHENEGLYYFIKNDYLFMAHKYSVRLSDNEICYLMDYLLHE